MKEVKNSKAIINKLASMPHFAPLKNHLFCKDFISLMMSEKEKNLIQRSFISKKIFYIITKHPSAYQSLNHDSSKKDIKFRINLYAKKYPHSDFSSIKDIKIFSKNYQSISEQKELEERKRINFIELSKANFKNNFSNNTHFKKFEELREIIKDARRRD